MRGSIFLASFLFLSPVLTSTCYWPSGKVAPNNWLPCPGSKHCCAETEACLSNGLCVAGKYMTVYRGACTDDSWPISECPRVCYEEIADQWANLYPCPSNNNEVFTCGTSGWSSAVCEAQLGNYTWVSGNVTVAQLGVASSSTTSSSATTSSATSFQPTESSTSTSTASCSASSATMKTGLGVGLGLGVPLLLALAGFVWLYVHTQRKIQSLQQKLIEQRAVYQGPLGDYAVPPPQELGSGKQSLPQMQSNYRSELA
ncbi:hypothetical protein BDV59DRAFT_174833 [Aspergillus ambiguus]|uniref:uncharacterized protein n=1 Tax=Aspergillus ambiguus TaxID=176160 RepID=UPI003CCDB2F4